MHPQDLHLIKGHEIRHHRNVVSYFDLDLEEFTLVDGIWIRGFVAGTGKSFIGEYFTQMNKRALF